MLRDDAVDEESQLRKLLEIIRPHLPASVIETSESLNGHGEWEIALSVCVHELTTSGITLQEHAQELIEECSMLFGHPPTSSAEQRRKPSGGGSQTRDRTLLR